MLTGFKEFLFRGNVVDLAVAVVMGTAFATLISAFTSAFLDPVLALLAGDSSLGLAFQLNDDNPDTVVDVGMFLSALVAFAITSAVVYFVIVTPMRALTERLTTAQEEAATVPADVALLAEIRDLLRQSGEQSGSAPSGAPGSAPTPPAAGSSPAGG
jgi:large conductance mechanosensitive channel